MARPSLVAVDWSDRPIQAGDRFVPLGPCQVSSRENLWLFEPNGWGGGRWVRVPRSQASLEIPDAAWNSYEWIVWSEDGPDYRLRIGVDREGQPTGIIDDVEGEWTSEPAE